mmetsp:Transcript_6279/g.9933  ORF Transcript_6279/g.9933 Transcript_6279/m.9933 type:complete len:293 (+) Transcript_6279:103-981(+)
MVSEGMWKWTRAPGGDLIVVPNYYQQQQMVKKGIWKQDGLAMTRESTPARVRMVRSYPYGRRSALSRLQTPQSPALAGPGFGTLKLPGLLPTPKLEAGGETDMMSRAMTPAPLSRQSTRSVRSKAHNPVFQVRFPGEEEMHEFNSWDEVRLAFSTRGYDPKNANIHSTAKDKEKKVFDPSQKEYVPPDEFLRRRLGILDNKRPPTSPKRKDTSYNKMSETLHELSASGLNPYTNRIQKDKLSKTTRNQLDPLHFYGTVNGGGISELKEAPRIARSPVNRSPVNRSKPSSPVG